MTIDTRDTRDTHDALETFEPLETGGYIPVEDSYDGTTYVLRAELPGIDPAEDVVVTVAGDLLTITGTRTDQSEEESDGHTLREFRYGSFARQLRLPAPPKVGDIEASYRSGVLEVRVPTARTDRADKVHHIKIKVGDRPSRKHGGRADKHAARAKGTEAQS